VYIFLSIRTERFLCASVQILAVIPSEIVRWVLVGAACLISTAFLVGNFFKVRQWKTQPLASRLRSSFFYTVVVVCQFSRCTRGDVFGVQELRSNLQYGIWIIAVVGLLHVGLALVFKLYFFRIVHINPVNSTVRAAASSFQVVSLWEPSC
jgi:hypothetical protein